MQLWIPAQRRMSDPVAESEYVAQRIASGYEFLPKLQVVMWGSCFLISVLSFISCSFTLVHAALTVLPPSIMFVVLGLVRGPMVMRHVQTCGVALQVTSFFANVLLRAVTAVISLRLELGDEVHVHRVVCIYLLAVFITVLFDAMAGYVPDRVYVWVYCPMLVSSWVYFEHEVGGLNETSCVMGLGVIAIGWWLRRWTDSMNRDCFEMARDLEEARDSLDEVMSAQQKLMSGFFDASCVCNGEGLVAKTEPQMAELLSCRPSDLEGTYLQQLAPPDEGERLQGFFDAAWKGAVGQTNIIQTTFKRSAMGSDPEKRVTTKDNVDVTIYCIKLPGPSKALPTMRLWAHGGLFLGVQEVGAQEAGVAQAAVSSRVASSSQETSPAADVGLADYREVSVRDTHSIIFDADTEGYEVLSCSTLFLCAGLGRRGRDGHGLLELLPKSAAKAFDDWVYDLIQKAPEGQFFKSPSVQTMSLAVPSVPGAWMGAKKAWLEIQHAPTLDGATPVVLRLHGVRMRGGGARASRPLEAIQEAPAQCDGNSELSRTELDEEEKEESIVHGHSSQPCVWESGSTQGDDDEASDSTTVLAPEDSASQVGSRMAFAFRRY